MAELLVVDDHLHVVLSRWEKVGALRFGDLTFPVGRVASVSRVANARDAIRGMRSPGTGWPGRIALGTWRTFKTVDFVAVYGNQPGYVIELQGQRFDNLVVSSKSVVDIEAITGG